MASPTVAANAYANLAKILDTGGPSKGGETQGLSFASVLKEAVGSVLETGRKSDAQAGGGAPGEAKVVGGGAAVAGNGCSGLDAGVGTRPRDPVLRRHHEDDDLRG